MYDPEEEEEEPGRFASIAGNLPPTKTIAASVTSSAPDPVSPKDDYGELAKRYADQAAYHKSQIGPVPNPADDSPSPTTEEAKSKGKPGEYGASASDLMSLL